MSVYVLVHGGQKGGYVWDDVAALLGKEGHRVYAPSLSPPQNSSLADHISEVCALMEEQGLDEVILAGHSYGSMVITGVADRLPARIMHLVYVDCAVPANGKSLYDMMASVGVSSQEYDLPQQPPFLEPLYFDQARIRRIPKTYVHCTASEFCMVGKPFFEQVVERAEVDNWDYYQLDSDHSCMISHPGELAEILQEGSHL